MTRARDVHAGFIPLTDCAPLVIAKELGFDRQHGINLHLHKDVSWANIRDKAESGLLDCAIMLAPMPLAATLGLGGRPPVNMIAAMATSLDGNAITLSMPLHASMCAVNAQQTRAGRLDAAQVLARVVAARKTEGAAPLTFGMVYPFSCHNYDLRLWLASAGIDPDHDVNLVVVPPPLIADSLKSGRIDGFCVGEPWNSVAVADGSGIVVATKAELWPRSPEKVLGLRAETAAHHPEKVSALVAAVQQACRWLDVPDNRADAARMLSAPHYVGISQDLIAAALSDTLRAGAPDGPGSAIVFARDGANAPLIAHATWLLTQMIRWGQVRGAFDIEATARSVYRPDLYCAAVNDAVAGNPMPPPYFAAWLFDAGDPVGYLSRLTLRDRQVDLSAFARLQSALR